ncbi:MAG: thiolase family protein [Candidatus Obscuribacterales bacterium]|nr:thiolase family protein [Candidatus Obscuribacterales bacterium]
MAQDKRVWLVAGSRTPIGSFGRSLKSVEVDKLAAHSMTQAVRRAGISESAYDGIVLGHGYQSSYAPNTARFAALNAGLPASIPAMTVQRQCGSGMEAAHLAANEIRLGNAELMIAGGAESMSTIPYMLPGKLRWNGPIAKQFKFIKLGPRPVVATLAENGLAVTNLIWDMKSVYMSGTAQRLADTYGISRAQADEYALRSQERANAAVKSGRFDREIDPISVPGKGFFSRDEHPRSTSLEKLTALSPVMKTRQITAGNSSGINDGACALVLASKSKVEELGLMPLAAIVDEAVVGVDPEQMGLGPVAAIQKLLERNKLTLKDIDLVEINEAFAAQYLACEKLLGLDREKTNVNGGAIALGHPIGMSGARLLLTLAYELKERGLKRGIAALCIGGGMGIATLIEAP